MEEAYVRSNVLLFLTAAVLLGVGVYSLMSYTRRHRQHVWDSVFFLVIGWSSWRYYKYLQTVISIGYVILLVMAVLPFVLGAG